MHTKPKRSGLKMYQMANIKTAQRRMATKFVFPSANFIGRTNDSKYN